MLHSLIYHETFFLKSKQFSKCFKLISLQSKSKTLPSFLVKAKVTWCIGDVDLTSSMVVDVKASPTKMQIVQKIMQVELSVILSTSGEKLFGSSSRLYWTIMQIYRCFGQLIDSPNVHNDPPAERIVYTLIDVSSSFSYCLIRAALISFNISMLCKVFLTVIPNFQY